jgi:uncharacterized membrane protein YcaP (DUF421 family)
MELNELLGPVTGELEIQHMLLRAFLTFIISFIFFRIAGLRTFGKMSFGDNITVLTIGAIMGRAIVSTQPFFPSMAAVLLIVLLHRLTTWLSFKSHNFGEIVKGEPIEVIKEGKYIKNNLRKTHLTEHDMEECMRLKGNTDELKNVKAAYLERSGEVSIVKAE